MKDDLNGYAYVPDASDRIYRNLEIDNNVVINSDGFHDLERSSVNHNNALRIAVVGDSFTASLHVPVSSTWTQVLEKKLSEVSQLPVEVVNLGLDGTGTDVHFNILNEDQRLGDLDAVILAFNENDLKDVELKRVFREVYDSYVITYQSPEQRREIIEYIRKDNPAPQVRFLYDNIYISRVIFNLFRRDALLRNNFISPKHAGIEYLNRYSKDEARNRLVSEFSKFIKLAQKHGFVFTVIPVPSWDASDKSMNNLMNNLPDNILQRISVVNVVPAINDLLRKEQVEYRTMFWDYDGHFNSTGHHMFGTALADTMHEILFKNQKSFQLME